MFSQSLILLITFLCLSSPMVQAHDNPIHTIQKLSKVGTLTADQLHQRALAYSAIAQNNQAIADLQAAIRLDPNQLGYHLDLARTYLLLQQAEQALASASIATRLATTIIQKTNLFVLQSEAYLLNKNYSAALKSINLAFQEMPEGSIDWFLLRSELQRALGQYQQRATDLHAGLQLHPSAVLKTHWIDALIDASQFSKALGEIDDELADRRWKSGYLIKRATALIGLHRTAEANASLHAALNEITPRIHPTHPDFLLLAEQATAYQLLNNPTAANQSIARLKSHHAPNWILNQLKQTQVTQGD